MQSDHQDWGPGLRRHLRTQHLGSATQYGEGSLPCVTQFGARRKRNAGLEHRGVIGGLGAREFKVSLAQPIERGERLRAAIVPRLVEHIAQCDISEKFIAITEMAIGRGRTHARPPGGLGKGEACRSFLRDQFQGGAQQCLFQIAVVVTARATPLVFRPAHVNSFYMSPRVTSMSPLGITPVTGIRRTLAISLPKPPIRATASAAGSITTDI